MNTTTHHKYEYAVDPGSDSAAARVVRMVGQNKQVLEVGPGPGSITGLLYELGKCKITALERDEDAISKVSQYCAHVHNDSWPELLGDKKFDVVVAADVLEHLYEPLPALEAMGRLVNENGSVVISLPHVGHIAVLACLLAEDFEYREWGLLDYTHIRFFGVRNVQSLFEAAGLKIVQAEYVIRHPEETEFAPRWAELSRNVQKALLSNPFGMVYQIVIKAVPSARPGKGISLMSVKPQSTHYDGRAGWKVRIKRSISSLLGPKLSRYALFCTRKLGIRF